MSKKTCHHCGLSCASSIHNLGDKIFCCRGCKSVFQLLKSHNLEAYYAFQKMPGQKPQSTAYEYLDAIEFKEKLIEFSDASGIQIITLTIPSIHCSSCIWVLEHLQRLDSGVKKVVVNFNKKTARIHFNELEISLKNLAELLNKIGYPPHIHLENLEQKKEPKDRSLIYKIAVSGFAFGNIMFLSFPEYFQEQGFWIDQYKGLFRWLSLLMSIPVVFYAAQDYFIKALKGIRAKHLTIDVPIALGIAVLFIRSSADVILNTGSGFFDSLSGLVFFLLIGVYFQQKTYAFLSFERDYKSYFPISVTVINKHHEEHQKGVNSVKKGDKLLIRHGELIPVDCVLKKGKAVIDYSFVTGESTEVSIDLENKLFAGGRQMGGAIEVCALKTIQQSYLTQLWEHQVFQKPKFQSSISKLTDHFSRYFTFIIISIALMAFIFWIFYDATQALNVFTAVLIIACPCALALAAPFTFGHSLRILGQHKFFIKNASIIEAMVHIDTIIFDKTGTLTHAKKAAIEYVGEALTNEEKNILKSTLRNSNHPHSRALYNLLKTNSIYSLDHFEEVLGSGLAGEYKNQNIKIGSAEYITQKKDQNTQQTGVHISSNDHYKGHFKFYNKYRSNITRLFKSLSRDYDLVVLTGDNNSERAYLEKILPSKTNLLFNQKPMDKLEYVEYHQNQGSKILMIGDGLNDAGALAQSDVGISLSEDINTFSPACDGILHASNFEKIAAYLQFCKQAYSVLKFSYIISIIYNIIGLYFAITGQLEPIVAAILMPLSSISIVVFTSLATNYSAKQLKRF